MFERELDEYEQIAAPRIGPSAASEARTELEVHLQADYAARVELGIEHTVARKRALAAMGDLMSIAKTESSAKSDAEGRQVLLWPVVFAPVFVAVWLRLSPPSLVQLLQMVAFIPAMWGVKSMRRIAWRELLLGGLFATPTFLIVSNFDELSRTLRETPLQLLSVSASFLGLALWMLVTRTMLGWSLGELRRTASNRDTAASLLLFIGLVGPPIWTTFVERRPIGLPFFYLSLQWSPVCLLGALCARRPLVVPAIAGGLVLAALPFLPFAPLLLTTTVPTRGGQASVFVATGLFGGAAAALQFLFAQTVLSAVMAAGFRVFRRARAVR